MTVKIVTDSTSDLTPEIANELGITIVPLYVHFGTEIYRDGIDLSTEDFYQKLPQSKELPTTSAPSPGDFATVFDNLGKDADEVLAITISSKLSATYNAATEGNTIRKNKNRVEIIDSSWAIAGLGLIVISAAKTAKAGANLDEVIKVTRRSMKKVDFRMAFDTLEYLKKGGRIGTAQAFLGSMLKMNPVLTIRDGSTTGVARLRCRAKAIDYLIDFVNGLANIEEIAVEDGTTPDETQALIDRLESGFPKERIYRMKVSPVIGTHVGPHVIGIGVIAG